MLMRRTLRNNCEHSFNQPVLQSVMIFVGWWWLLTYKISKKGRYIQKHYTYACTSLTFCLNKSACQEMQCSRNNGEFTKYMLNLPRKFWALMNFRFLRLRYVIYTQWKYDPQEFICSSYSNDYRKCYNA